MPDFASAIAHLRQVDPRLAAVIDRVGPCRLDPDRYDSHFAALVRSIVSQQLSTKAAATIHGRLRALLDEQVTPERLLAQSDEALRGVGLSRQKIAYMRDLSEQAASGALPLDAIDGLDDAAVIAALTQVKGIGRWTVQMLMLFRMGRPDVLPDLDLGIQKAIQRLYALPEMPKPKEVLSLGAHWRPHASVASWYLWRSLELP
ncbi:MAG TPA: DNA-3-methyladenine glycosylase [Oscillatoriaceae cyanobacterium]